MRQNAFERPRKDPRDSKRSDDLLTNMTDRGLQGLDTLYVKTNVLVGS